MKIGFVSQWYTPERASATLPGVITKALADAGHEVTVLTGLPNYPDGRLYPGYKFLPYQREVIDGIRVHRAPLFINHDSNPLKRVANYSSFAASASAIALGALRSVDAVWVHSTPATAAGPAMVLRALRGIPYVLHIQDMWPDTVTASGFMTDRRSAQIERPLHAFCNAAYRHASAVRVTAPGMKNLLQKRGVEVSKIEFLPNWCDETVFRPTTASPDFRASFGNLPRFSVMYAGAMGDVQGLDVVLDAAALLKHRNDIGFVLVGDGVAREKLAQRTDREGLSNVVFRPSQPIENMAEVMDLSDIQLICLRDIPLYRITLPSKVQATMAAGRPIIASAAGDAARVVTESGAGLVCSPGSPTKLARAVIEAYDAGAPMRKTWGEAGRKHYLDHYSQSRGVAKMTATLKAAGCPGVR